MQTAIELHSDAVLPAHHRLAVAFQNAVAGQIRNLADQRPLTIADTVSAPTCRTTFNLVNGVDAARVDQRGQTPFAGNRPCGCFAQMGSDPVCFSLFSLYCGFHNDLQDFVLLFRQQNPGCLARHYLPPCQTCTFQSRKVFGRGFLQSMSNLTKHRHWEAKKSRPPT